ncbi:NACHT domain-containing protein [Micromonospora inositola]|uniref:NACHT domain-containing protein n=1 Tax=Micromonospora inositola TaxID=47865 RepID=A0A1C5K5U1_9ACTN|nr:NACHT domain-containing protein [Micromonospora inositola]
MLSDGAEAAVVLTYEQEQQISSLLKSPEVFALAAAYVLVLNTQARTRDLGGWAEECENAFQTLFASRVPGIPAASDETAALIWRIIVENLKLILPTVDGLRRLSDDDIDSLLAGDTGFNQKKPAPLYVRRIVAIARDVARAKQIRELCVDISCGMQEATSELRLEHTQEHHRFSHDALYVSRTLSPARQGDPVEANHVLADPHPGTNLVIIGHPGAGKSTFVTRLAGQIAQREESDYAPVIVRCREFGSDADVDVTDQVALSIKRATGIDVTEDDLRDLLSVGRCFLIFDGVDELVDIQARRSLIGRIEMVAYRYPLTSIVCTTRKIGYESARFESPRFSVHELHEYTPDQVEEYATRWFKLMERPKTDRMAFVRESEDIQEIRRNPLMLSLLCTLYRVRGYIPMNRRDVYKDCADLLFYGWDALRHIPQPVDHRRYGHTLMEELADFFFKFPSTGAGVEEGQLTRLIGIYFQDTAGVQASEADQRAAEFLSFCANRAWLLTATGFNARGQRLFAFTHRTFMEFYAAEAVVRRARSEDDVLQTAAQVYRDNPSSVLPDLIVQAYENKTHRGAEMLLRRLIKDPSQGGKLSGSPPYPLCLRILNATPVGAPLVRDVLTSTFRAWAQLSDDVKKGAFISLLQLYKDPRLICIGMLTGSGEGHPQDTVGFRKVFVECWAALWLLGEADLFLDEWGRVADEIVEADNLVDCADSEVLQSYLTLTGHLDPQTGKSFYSQLVLACFGEMTPGLLLQAIQKLSVGQEEETDRAIIAIHGRRLATSPPKIHPIQEKRLSQVLANLVPRMADFTQAAIQVEGAFAVLMWLACFAAEEYPGDLHPFHEVARGILPDDLLLRILATRSKSLVDEGDMADDLEGVKPLNRRERRAVAESGPSWLQRWMNGRLGLTF